MAFAALSLSLEPAWESLSSRVSSDTSPAPASSLRSDTTGMGLRRTSITSRAGPRYGSATRNGVASVPISSPIASFTFWYLTGVADAKPPAADHGMTRSPSRSKLPKFDARVTNPSDSPPSVCDAGSSNAVVNGTRPSWTSNRECEPAAAPTVTTVFTSPSAAAPLSGAVSTPGR